MAEEQASTKPNEGDSKGKEEENRKKPGKPGWDALYGAILVAAIGFLIGGPFGALLGLLVGGVIGYAAGPSIRQYLSDKWQSFKDGISPYLKVAGTAVKNLGVVSGLIAVITLLAMFTPLGWLAAGVAIATVAIVGGYRAYKNIKASIDANFGNDSANVSQKNQSTDSQSSENSKTHRHNSSLMSLDSLRTLFNLAKEGKREQAIDSEVEHRLKVLKEIRPSITDDDESYKTLKSAVREEVVKEYDAIEEKTKIQYNGVLNDTAIEGVTCAAFEKACSTNAVSQLPGSSVEPELVGKLFTNADKGHYQAAQEQRVKNRLQKEAGAAIQKEGLTRAEKFYGAQPILDSSMSYSAYDPYTGEADPTVQFTNGAYHEYMHEKAYVTRKYNEHHGLDPKTHEEKVKRMIDIEKMTFDRLEANRNSKQGNSKNQQTQQKHGEENRPQPKQDEENQHAMEMTECKDEELPRTIEEIETQREVADEEARMQANTQSHDDPDGSLQGSSQQNMSQQFREAAQSGSDDKTESLTNSTSRRSHTPPEVNAINDSYAKNGFQDGFRKSSAVHHESQMTEENHITSSPSPSPSQN